MSFTLSVPVTSRRKFLAALNVAEASPPGNKRQEELVADAKYTLEQLFFKVKGAYVSAIISGHAPKRGDGTHEGLAISICTG